ncbi:MAG: hypothetical protein A3B96_03370 [Candidatus Spechtbacteria bacterium RIFCSPHIGHO2_02_FULL_43_15b]|nr:MAG: hypothetical protein A3B96_03370 [Candidatus Spechtbacteria bacterium RIFCSPHIGHO2_02_FULL_43_15b]
MRVNPKKFAVFDIDGTIFRSSLLVELTRELIEDGIFPITVERVYIEELQRWMDRRGSYGEYINKVVEAYRSNIRGVFLDDVLEVSERMMIFHKNHVYRYTRDLIKKLKNNYFLLAISHSPYHIVEPFCREWGFQKVYAQIYELDNAGKFTGVIEYEDLITRKGKVLERAIEKEKLTLAGSIGVGDTDSDIPMLRMVSRAIAFNPNKKLYQAARKNRWEIIVERKDMVYRI